MSENEQLPTGKHPQVAAAWIGGAMAFFGTVAAAVISQHPAVVGGQTAGAAKQSTSSDQSKDQRASESTPDNVEIPARPIADGTAYYVTLYPPPPSQSTGGAGKATPVTDVVFHAPKDERKWVRLTINKGGHFKEVDFTASDSQQSSSDLQLKADDVSDKKPYELKTEGFTVRAAVMEVISGVDTDATAPLDGKVFKKLLLRINVDEAGPKSHGFMHLPKIL